MSFKQVLFGKYLTIRNLFVAGNALLLLLFLAAVARDQAREWKPYQKEYLRREKKRIKEALAAASSAEDKDRLSQELAAVKAQGSGIRQVMLPELDRYDRCQTCHLGLDQALNPSMSTPYPDAPHAAKPNAVHKAHPVEKFGCTVCHGGQGLATTVKAAHGEVKHWEEPLRRGPLLQASCAKCHGDTHNPQAMPFTAAWRKGESLFVEKGCIGCHQVRGAGGPISVDLAEDTANKPLSRIDFSTTGLPKEQHTLANWVRLHFIKDPQELVPGDPHGHHNDEPIAPSGMPFFSLSEEDADALTVYVMAMAKDRIPLSYHVSGAPRPEPVFSTAEKRGRHAYEKYGCAACHGPDGKGGIRNYNYENQVEPDLTKTVGTFTRQELKDKISHGVPVVGKADPKGPTPPLYMPPWKDKIKGSELEDLVSYLLSIGEKQEEW